MVSCDSWRAPGPRVDHDELVLRKGASRRDHRRRGEEMDALPAARGEQPRGRPNVRPGPTRRPPRRISPRTGARLPPRRVEQGLVQPPDGRRARSAMAASSPLPCISGLLAAAETQRDCRPRCRRCEPWRPAAQRRGAGGAGDHHNGHRPPRTSPAGTSAAGASRRSHNASDAVATTPFRNAMPTGR